MSEQLFREERSTSWDNIEEMKADIPCKEVLPAVPRPLNQLRKKYAVAQVVDKEKGTVREPRKEEIYRKYYEVKFRRMCEKNAVDLYQDYLTRVRSDYDQKNKNIFNNRSQFTNFSQQILCLPAKSRTRVQDLINKK